MLEIAYIILIFYRDNRIHIEYTSNTNILRNKRTTHI